MTHDDAQALIAQQFDDGAIPALQNQALRAHLRACEDCRAIYDRHARLERALDGGRAQAERVIARGRGWQAPPAPSTRRPRWPWLAAVAAAAAIAFFVLRPHPQTSDWTARGDGTGVQATITILKLAGADARPERIVAPIRQTDGLIFSYTNPTQNPFTHVLIVGRDAGGNIRWYHPQWTDPSQTPMSIPVQAGADVPLPTAVWHSYSPGSLEVCAIFTHKPLAVPTLDAQLEAGSWPPTDGRCQTVKVKP